MKLNFKNLLTVGNILTCLTLILTIVSMSLYGASVTMAGYFIDTGDGLVYALTSLAVVFLIAIICLNFIEFDGWLGFIKSICKDVLIILTVLFLMIALMTFISSKVEGFAFIFFSADAGKDEIQTPENLASAQATIVAIIMYAVTWLFATVSSFFSMDKKKEAVAETAK